MFIQADFPTSSVGHYCKNNNTRNVVFEFQKDKTIIVSAPPTSVREGVLQKDKISIVGAPPTSVKDLNKIR